MKTWVDFRCVKAAVTMTAVLQRYQVAGLKKHGNELRGRCPIHQGEGKDSFHVNVEKNCFHCFSCKAKGNVLDFVAAMEQCSVRDAALKLQDWFGLAVDNGLSGKPAARIGKTETDAYLAGEDRVGDGDRENKPLAFELKGIDHEHPYLTGRGISRETAKLFGVGLFSGKGSMSGRVVIPIHNQRGELVAYAGRSIDGTEPRYKLPAGFRKRAVLFNQHRATLGERRGLIVVEGFFDCMKVHQAGYPFVVALMGCSMSEEQEGLLQHAGMVLLMLDGDEAGRTAAAQIATSLCRHAFIKVVDVGAGCQADQLSSAEINALLRG